MSGLGWLTETSLRPKESKPIKVESNTVFCKVLIREMNSLWI